MLFDIALYLIEICSQLPGYKNCVEPEGSGFQKIGYQVLTGAVSFAHTSFASVPPDGFTQTPRNHKPEQPAFVGIIVDAKAKIDKWSPPYR